MALPKVILDTDILSAIMRRQSAVIPTARAYLREHHQFHFSIITQYEILRGLKAKDATRQTATFENFCSRNIILPLSEETISKAAEIYADLYKRGELIGDADILIAASAMVHGLGIVTNNERHFQRISDLQVENWLK
ncbi:MAG: type II toxin-antitoxin system VapC family toxin [Candidatus Latescibacteria bacterium]|nr:type II toxin-antitoxin system VapC family toxin [Candidatus Latescibacterota bacterium]